MNESIYGFCDPGAFLRSAYRVLKKREPGISHRYISAVLGLKSPAIFCLLTRGKLHPSPLVLDGLARIFSLGRRERAYLSLLFILRKNRDPLLREFMLSEFESRTDFVQRFVELEIRHPMAPEE